MRALLRKRSQVETKYVNHDIIRDYAKYESSAYGPLTRDGHFPDRLTDRYLVKSRFLDTYTGLLELESTLPPDTLKIRPSAPKRITSTKDGHLKRQFRRERDLNNIFQDIASQKGRQHDEPRPLRFLVKVEKPLPRPPTPGVDRPDAVSITTSSTVRVHTSHFHRRMRTARRASSIFKSFFVAERFKTWYVAHLYPLSSSLVRTSRVDVQEQGRTHRTHP